MSIVWGVDDSGKDEGKDLREAYDRIEYLEMLLRVRDDHIQFLLDKIDELSEVNNG